MNRHSSKQTRAEEKVEVDESLGIKLRQIRQKLSLSQRELARRSGITHTTISLIESGRISPSLSSLKKVLDAMDMNLSEFFADNLQMSRRKAFFRADSLTLVAQGKGLDVFQVGEAIKADMLQMLIGHYRPGADTGEEMLRHEGEEIGVIAAGRFEVTVGDTTIVLDTGDAFHFDSTIPHRFRNVSDVEGVIIRAGTVPSI